VDDDHPVTAVDATRTLGDLVAERPARAAVLERLGLDYCCHGDRPLAHAARAAGLDPEELAEVLDCGPEDPVCGGAGLGGTALADHIVDVHHAYLRAELPALETLAGKVYGVHGDRHPELAEVVGAIDALRREIEPHLDEEERRLFPALRGEAAPDVADVMSRLERDHRGVAGLLTALRHAARDYAAPDDGCASYRLLYARLRDLEADVHLHVHEENNVLFREAVAG
jgi:regulator of cell morphogenesis and NO signaling